MKNEWIRLPGLFRRREAEQLIHEPGEEYRTEEAGHLDGVALFAIYHRPAMGAAKESER